ncbi:MAG: DUF448 domain-containing protein [Alphaproteobacteria bacterium]|jgi:predicted RNA-binding protein YlxR (DUF448 family)|nr:DUF448 domain-containing protein [Alphaproteobacteria bacterium]
MEKQKRDILSKELKNKSELIRFVLGPENKIFADLNEKLPGRGMWLQANKEALDIAIEKRLFNKACKADCNIDKDFPQKVTELLKKKVLDYISISKKTGNLTIGFEKVTEACKKQYPKIFIIASDSGADGKSKFRKYISSEDIVVIDSFKAIELQEVLGQDSLVVYGCVKKSSIADNIVASYNKMKNFL